MKKEKIVEEKVKEEKKVEELLKEINTIKKDGEMKKQIITLVIGILIGAVITAAIFLIAKPKGGRNIPDFSQFEKGGEKVKPGDRNFDFSKEGRPSRNRDGSKKNDNSKVDENNKTDDAANEDKA